VQKGYKLRGTGEIVPAGNMRFDQLVPPLAAITQGAFKIHDIVVIRVTAVEPILAPSYRMVAGTSEQSQIAAAMRAYGVVERAAVPGNR
jgi:hypothetical protein